jgi:hypothetical protein
MMQFLLQIVAVVVVIAIITIVHVITSPELAGFGYKKTPPC